MAYNFTDATLLGYQVNKNYLGEGVFALNTIKNISIEGILDNRIDNADSEGVKQTFQKISGFLTGIVNAYDAVIINGYNLGTGKVTNLSFPDQNPIRLGSYKYDIEIVENSDFSNIQTGDIYGTFLSGVSDKILALDETLNFDNAANGDYSYNHDLNIQYYDTGSDLFAKSKDFANSIYNDSLKLGLIGSFSGFYDVLKTKKNYFSETYDLISKRCGFSKRILINKNYNSNYSTTLSHVLSFDANGKISVTEQGIIKGLDNTLNYTADNYFNTELANSYTRCQNIFNVYAEKYGLSTKDSLFNQPFNLGKTADWFNNILEYSVSYVNDPAFEGNIINTYNITVNKDIQEVGIYTEQGELTQVGQFGDITGLNLIKTKYQDAKTRASTNYPTYKLKNSSLSLGFLGNTNLPETINLSNWPLDDFGQDINGLYTYRISGVRLPYSGTFNGYAKDDGYNSYIYFNNNKWNQYSSGTLNLIDPDAEQYISDSYITGSAEQRDINNFVLGLKNLNIWSGLDNIWLLKSGYNNGSGDVFFDLKSGSFNPSQVFSGFQIGTINKTLSGYKMPSASSLINYLSYPNHPIRFTGTNCTSMFLLENYTSAPTNQEILFSSESFQGSGFRMGYQGGGEKEFTIWSNQSTTGIGFLAKETAVHAKPYSFITAGIKNNLQGRGTGVLLVDDKNKVEAGGDYNDWPANINTFPAPAGGTYTFGNNTVLFIKTKQDIFNQHSGIKSLAKRTFAQNLDFPATIETWTNSNSSSPNILPLSGWIRSNNSTAYGSINSFAQNSTYNNNFSYSIEKTNDNSILEGHPYYKSLSMKIDDQSPTNMYKEYIIANKNPKNVLFLFGNQVEIGNRSVNINGTLVRPTGNFWDAPIAFPLTDLKSKSISGALNLISNDAYIDNINYSYDSDNNFSFNLSVKYLDKVV
jgi:hypothetical protein